jgi:hypothetical protein
MSPCAWQVACVAAATICTSAHNPAAHSAKHAQQGLDRKAVQWCTCGLSLPLGSITCACI